MIGRNSKWHTVLAAVRVVAMAVLALVGVLTGDALMLDGQLGEGLARLASNLVSSSKSSELPAVLLLRPSPWA